MPLPTNATIPEKTGRDIPTGQWTYWDGLRWMFGRDNQEELFLELLAELNSLRREMQAMRRGMIAAGTCEPFDADEMTDEM